MINLKIASPDSKIFDGQCSQVTIKTISGVVSILPNHVPFVSVIENGYVRIKDGIELDVKSGYVSVGENSMIEIIVMK